MRRGDEYRALHASGMSYTQIAARFGVSTQAVQQQCGGRKSRRERERRRRERLRDESARTYRCSNCGAAGHNIQTCTMALREPEPPMADAPPRMCQDGIAFIWRGTYRPAGPGERLAFYTPSNRRRRKSRRQAAAALAARRQGGSP